MNWNWKHVLGHVGAVAAVIVVVTSTIVASAPGVRLPAVWTAYIGVIGGAAAGVVALAHDLIRQAPPPK